MIQRKKKQLLIVLFISLIVVALLGAGAVGIHFLTKDNTASNAETKDLSQFELKRLIIGTQLELEETYNAKYVELLMNGENGDLKLYLVEYNTVEETAEAYEKFKANEKIESVDIDRKYESGEFKEEVFSFNLKNLGKAYNWGPVVMGLDETQTHLNEKQNNEEIIVAVIDSGFDRNHSFIKEDTELSNRILKGFNGIDRSEDVTDNSGHGTNVGGIILESTPNNVKILPIKALDINEEGKATGTSASLISGINYAIANDADIINMSLGGDTQTVAEQQAIDRAYKQGITCIVAAGNGDKDGNALNLDEPGKDCYPAEANNVITIGAVKNNLLVVSQDNPWEDIVNKFDTYSKATINDFTKTSFSNYGKVIDFAAPGELIVGITNETEQGNIRAYSGTSQAAPHISAAAATIKTYNKDYTSDQVEEILEYYAEDLGDEGKDTFYGNGFVTFKDFEECPCHSDKCEGIYCFGCSKTSCIYHPGQAKKLSSIEITNPPDKINYINGSSFEPAGMEVTAKYSDNSTKVITDYTYQIVDGEGNVFTTFDINQMKGTSNNLKVANEQGEPIINKQVVITYQEGKVKRKAVQAVNIVNKELKAIEVTTPPTKVRYMVGETFDPAGMVVSAEYNDGSKKEVTTYQYSPTGALVQANGAITISYTEGTVTKTTTQSITVSGEPVIEAVLQEIEITTPPTKKTYTVGERFDPTGMVITAKYDDNTSQIVTNYTYEPQEVLSANDTEITISYTEGEVTKKATQAITVNSRKRRRYTNSTTSTKNFY